MHSNFLPIAFAWLYKFLEWFSKKKKQQKKQNNKKQTEIKNKAKQNKKIKYETFFDYDFIYFEGN